MKSNDNIKYADLFNESDHIVFLYMVSYIYSINTKYTYPLFSLLHGFPKEFFFLFLSHSTKCYCVWTRALCTHLTGNPELIYWLTAHAHCVCISSHKIKVLSTENCIWVKVSQFQKDLIFHIRKLQVSA